FMTRASLSLIFTLVCLGLCLILGVCPSAEAAKGSRAQAFTATSTSINPEWHLATVQPSVSARAYLAMAYDTGRGRVVLFGGSDASGVRGDTWNRDDTLWAETTPATSPPARAYHAI